MNNTGRKREKTYVVIKLGGLSQRTLENIRHFLDDFLNELGNNGHDLANEPLRNLIADDENHVIGLLEDFYASNTNRMDFLLIFYEDDTFKFIKQNLRDRFKNLKMYTIQTNFMASIIPRRGNNQKLEKFCQDFARQMLNDRKDGPKPNQNALNGRRNDQNPGPNRTNQANGMSGSNSSNTERKPIGFIEIESICADLESRKLLPSSSDLFNRVNKPSYFERLNDLWPEAEKQVKFLQTINATASTIQSDLLTLTYEFLKKVLDSKLIEYLVDNHVFQINFDPKKRTPTYARLYDHLVSLLIKGFETLPSAMDRHLQKIQMVVMNFSSPVVQNMRFLLPETNEKLEMLQISLKARFEAREQEINQKDTQKAQRRQNQHHEFQGSPGLPPENYRNLTIMPKADDIIDNGPVFLRPAIKLGKYDDNEHYLDVQFRLMREDMLRPLREGIVEYRKNGVKGTDLFVYKGIKLEPAGLHKQTGDLMTKAKLQVKRRMRWNKRLKYGSLVCLSHDDFKNNFIFATVLDRDELPKALVGLKFDNPADIDLKKEYIMVESSAFYECYKYVMMALQSVPDGGEVPFSKYLVQVQTQTDYPIYLTNNGLHLNFKILLKRNFGNTILNVPRIHRDLMPHHFGMDRSQFEALHYALTSDLAVIQGPPGTGKTYIGLQIARLLFENEEIWNRDGRTPMLVVCYTNHALDQFLEGILKFLPEGIVRIGGRCKNPALEEFTLPNIRKKNNKKIDFRIFKNYINERAKFTDLAKYLSELTNVLKALRSGLPKPALLITTMVKYKGRRLIEGGKDDKTLYNWLMNGKKNDVLDMDVAKVRALVGKGHGEIAVKNAMFLNTEANMKGLTAFLNNNRNNPRVTSQLRHEIQFWPRLQDIDVLKNAGFDDEAAYQMLLSTNGNLVHVQELINQFRQHTQNAPPAENADRAQDTAILEEITLYMDEEDDRDRMNFNFDDFMEENPVDDKNDASDTTWFNQARMASFAKHIVSAPPMAENEVHALGNNLWDLPLQDRWRLYQFWVRQARKPIKEKLAEMEGEYSQTIKKLAELRALSDLDLLRGAKVIGMTTTGAAMHQATLRALKPKIVIIEEAAEVLEAHVLTSLTPATEHAILIGDHKQLRPNPSVYELAKKYNLEISLFERLINNNYPYKMLENQHRMRPEISTVLMPHFYPSLRDDESVKNYPSVLGIKGDMFFISHNQPEVKDSELKSHSNPYEAEYAVRLARYLRQQNYKDEEITILCTYLEQWIEIKNLAKQIFGEKHGIRIENVDNYQGEECEIIILSLVRSQPSDRIGFLNVDNRVCVALSRAKQGLYVLANIDFLANKCDLWKRIKQSVEEAGALAKALPVICQIHGNEQTIEHYREFDEKCPEGGCKEPCGTRLECGHSCTKPCHAYDPIHEKMPCTKRCQRTCASTYKHPCKKLCYMPCGDCQVKVEKHLPCGHNKEDACYLPPDQVQCVEKCTKTLICGHPCFTRCGTPCATKCEKRVEKRLLCGHIGAMKCYQDPATRKCTTLVKKVSPVCKHEMEVECHVNVEEVPCPNPCNTPLPVCSHICQGTCGSCRNGRLHNRCQENCQRILVCGHECTFKCSRVCPPCERACETACTHSQCSRNTKTGEDTKKLREVENEDKRKKKGRLCGDPCPSCAENCSNECEHRKCSKRCWEPCDVQPCMEPCNKRLKCSPEGEDAVPHMCIGLCGEECPKVCKICDKEKFEKEVQMILFGFEDDDNARFVQLKDCQHILEVTGLDNWIKTQSGENGARYEEVTREDGDENQENTNTQGDTAIVMITCPMCKTPIRRSRRYISVLNQRAIDLEQIKQILRGKKKAEVIQEWNELKDKAKSNKDQLLDVIRKADPPIDENLPELPIILMQTFEKMNVQDVNKEWLTIADNILRIADQLTKVAQNFYESYMVYSDITTYKSSPRLVKILLEFKITSLKRYFWKDFYALLSRVACKDVRLTSEATLDQLIAEVDRLGMIHNLFNWVVKFKEFNVDLNKNDPSSSRSFIDRFFMQKVEEVSTNEKKLRSLLVALNHPYKEKTKDQIKTIFNELVERTKFEGFVLSEQELIKMANAVAYSATNPYGGNKWYKCPNGHLYTIGNCGYAMVQSKCAECGAAIGGGGHQLLNSNQQATDLMRNVPRNWVDPALMDLDEDIRNRFN